MDAACINPSQALGGATEALFKISDCNYWSHLRGGGMFNRCRSSTVKNKEDVWRVELYMK